MGTTTTIAVPPVLAATSEMPDCKLPAQLLDPIVHRLRLSATTLLLLIASCTAEPPGPQMAALALDGRALVGRPFDELPVHEIAAPTNLSTTSGGTCRLIVVGSSSCPYTRSLALGWKEDMLKRLREAGVEARATWVVYGDSAGRREMLRRSHWEGVEVREASGDIVVASKAMGISAVPQTFLVDSTGTIRAVFAGNNLMSKESLQAVCNPAPVRGE